MALKKYILQGSFTMVKRYFLARKLEDCHNNGSISLAINMGEKKAKKETPHTALKF